MRSHFYANIFMASFESKYICSYIKEKVITFLWSIDDLFMIWIGTKEELLKFINELNQKYKTSIWFQVFKNINNKLQTTLYKKKPDRQSYLQADSEHPRSLKESIPYRKKKSRHKISSVKKIVGKKFRHWESNLSLFSDEFFCLAIWRH